MKMHKTLKMTIILLLAMMLVFGCTGRGSTDNGDADATDGGVVVGDDTTDDSGSDDTSTDDGDTTDDSSASTEGALPDNLFGLDDSIDEEQLDDEPALPEEPN